MAEITLADLLDPKLVAKLPDAELLAKHWRLHQNWATQEGDETIFNAHLVVLAEMLKRSLQHRCQDLDSLDEAALRFLPAYQSYCQGGKAKAQVPDRVRQVVEAAPEFVWVPGFVALSGSFLYGEEPHDVDVVIRSDVRDEALEIKLAKWLVGAADLPAHFIYCPTGPAFDSVPLFDLVLRPRPSAELVEVDEEEFKPFYGISLTNWLEGHKAWPKPQVYEVAGEFYQGEDEKELRRWVRGWLEKGQEVLVQVKYDGLRMLAFKDGRQVKIYTSDTKAERSQVLDLLASEIAELPARSLVLDFELVEYPQEKPRPGQDQPLPRRLMVWASAAQPKTAEEKEALRQRQERTFLFCHDLLYLDGQSLVEKGYAERFAALAKLLQGSPPHLRLAETWTVRKEEELEKALRAACSWPGSEGAMLKAGGFPYKTTGANQGVAKYKLVREVDCLVIGYRFQTKGKPKAEHWSAAQAKEKLSDQLDSGVVLLRCAIQGEGGRLIPIEADKTATKQDLDLAWDEERQEWEGQEGPAFWHMAEGWPQLQEHEYFYGRTYATSWEKEEPPLGYIVTVAPVEMELFEKKDGSLGLAWTFPRVRNFKPKGSPLGKLQDILKAFDLDPGASGKIRPSHQPAQKEKALAQEDDEGEGEDARQPLNCPGGKSKLARRLLPLIPPHRRYVEPFAGAAALFFAKDPSPEEVLNDLHPEIIALYRFLKSASDEEFRKFLEQDWEGKESLYVELYNSQPKELWRRAYRIWYLSYFGWQGPHAKADDFRHHMAASHRRPHLSLERLQALRQRLRHTRLENRDAFEVIREYDSPETFFYLDPPYLESDAGYDYRLSADQWQALVDLLKKVKGKFLLSLNPDTLRELHIPAGWEKRTFLLIHHMKDEKPLRQEIVLANFSLKEKALEEEGAETREEAALAYWQENWWKAFPPQGNGRFVYQHHWRGLTEEETQLSDQELLQTGHSLHGDLRFEGADGKLWGVTIMLGTAADNLKAQGDRLIHLPQDDNLQVQWKPAQPPGWLDVGDPPLVMEPGQVTATALKWSKMFKLDSGTYQMGVWREHLFEVFLQGKELQGRFLIEFAPFGNRREWIIDKPADQTPYAESRQLEEVVRELHQKKQEYLVWAKPGQKPELIEVEKAYAGLKKEKGSFLQRLAALLGLGRKRADKLPTAFQAIKVFQGSDGRPWLLAFAANPFRDNEQEFLALDALRAFVEKADPRQVAFRFWHLPGTDFGRVAWQALLNDRFLVQVGPFDDTAVGRYFADFLQRYQEGHPTIAPWGWGTSVGFVYPRHARQDGVYREINILETSVVPWQWAANPYVPLDVDWEVKMNDKQREALLAIGGEDLVELVELAENMAGQLAERLDGVVEFRAKRSADLIRQVANGVEDESLQKQLMDLADEVDDTLAKGGDCAKLVTRLRLLAGKVGGDAEKKLSAIADKIEGYAKAPQGYGYGYPKPKALEEEESLALGTLAAASKALEALAQAAEQLAAAKADAEAKLAAFGQRLDELDRRIAEAQAESEAKVKAALEALPRAAFSPARPTARPAQEEKGASLAQVALATLYGPQN